MGDKVKIEFELQLGDQGIRVAIAVPSAPVPARRMLPLFQGLADQVVEAAADEAAKRHEAVSCTRGCTACCRHVVPISATEAHFVRALVDAMPEPRRTEVRARFADGIARLEAAGLLEDVRAFDGLPEEKYRTLHPRYFALGMSCPFLEDGACSIYRQRPLVCREYHATSPAEQCAGTGPVRTLPLRGFVSHAVTQLEGSGPEGSRLALLLALEWTEAHPGDAPTLRPATEWIDKVLEGVTGKPLPDAVDEPPGMLRAQT